MKSKNKIKLGYEISLQRGSLRPLKLQFWNTDKQFQQSPPLAPLKYMADAMVGLSLVQLNQFLKSPLMSPHVDYSFAHEAWQNLDPHHELYKRSQERVQALHKKSNLSQQETITRFEKNFCQHFEKAQKPWGIDFQSLSSLLEVINQFEVEAKSSLLFNFDIKFSRQFTEKLHLFFSLLFHLRSLVAVDHNAHIDDSSHEAVKVDAITDYLPKSDYIANDALLYWNFKKAVQSSGTQHLQEMENKFFAPMTKAFHKYAHNACRLIDNLPASFLSSMSPVEMEEALYLVQMDWLLGSDAGLLFKIREELFGLQNGYESLFWNEVEPKHAKEMKLSVCFELDEKHVYDNQAA